MAALGLEPEGGRDGDVLGMQHNKKGVAARQSCWNIKAWLENAAYELPQPFPSTVPCPMLQSAGILPQIGGGLGVPLLPAACLEAQGGPSYPGTQRVHPKVAEPGG